ncbi:hypothetical protein LTR36_008890 [Oleoguttula mirabilis]|uniref:Large ribosomal subunit protein bL21m n=1 Tax=Oleoguttula mirabilis TaxID=1507867 RepID=A0AAV9J741_9PEZI|nr:hypothetical protein LTR36_008890 [Oleoguttula mirabilis]
MLSRNLKRALLDSRFPLPPTFLLPWAAGLTTVSHTTEAGNVPPPLLDSAQHVSTDRQAMKPVSRSPKLEPPKQDATQASIPELTPPSPTDTSPMALSQSVRDLLPLLQAQGSHYITAHIYDRPYLLTQGDTVRLPFFMKDVAPGDILRLTKASNIGSRDYTLKASAPAPKLKSSTMTTMTVLDPTTGSLDSHSRVMATPSPDSDSPEVTSELTVAPHFIPHIAKGKVGYLDDRLFVCRAVVMGVEAEPMRVKEKTKRRQRKVKSVKSKHRYTILKVKEVRIRGVDEIEGGVELD